MPLRRTDTTLQRGIRFLLAGQGGDGLWRDFLTPAGEASQWPTGFIASALHLADAPATPLLRAADALVTQQNEDGGWGYNETVPTDADSTACALLFLACIGDRASACRRAASCLARHQRSGDAGGVATYREPDAIRRFMGVGRWMRFRGWCAPHVEVTAVAGRALAMLGPADRGGGAEAAWRYVRSQQRGDGSWGSYWWASPHYATLQAVGLGVLLDDREAVGRAADWALRTQTGDGGWSAPDAATSAFATALSLSVLLHAGATGRAVERARSRLAALQDDDGGWASHPIMRIPLPGDAQPDRRRLWRLAGRGFVVRDHRRMFTSAACVAALAQGAGFD
jgi:squalene-hopene/tetraprenyl-beta-curcumene cyclase